jgi:lactoylglutathione lyase/glyoxylase I family protein
MTSGDVMPLEHPAKNPDSPFASATGHHVAVRVPDYDAAKRWYVDKLDLRVVREWPWAGMRLAYLSPPTDDGFHIEIIGDGNLEPARPYEDTLDSMRYPGYNHVCLEVNSLDDALAELRRRGVTVIGEPFEIEEISARMVVIADPWGNMIEVSGPLGS